MRSARYLSHLVCIVACVALGGCSGGDDSSPQAGTQDITAGAAAKPKASVKDSRFRQLKSGPTNRNLAPLSTAGTKMDSSLIGTFKFLKPTNEATDQTAREKRVKEAMHRFMCGFFDESIDLKHQTGPQGAKNVISDLDLDNNDTDAGNSAGAKGVVAAMDGVTKDRDLDVMSGSASGNNTVGEVMGVYDIKNNEVFFFGFSNCGSDD